MNRKIWKGAMLFSIVLLIAVSFNSEKSIKIGHEISISIYLASFAVIEAIENVSKRKP